MQKILFTKKGLDRKMISKELGENLDIDFVDVLSFENLKIPTFDLKNKSLIFTSVQGVNAFFENGFSPNENFVEKDFNKIYTVGKKSKNALRKHGFGTFKIKNNAKDLAKFIIENFNKENFLHFCGNLALDTLQVQFKNEKIKYKKVVVYNTKFRYPEIENPFDEVVFFSPSGVQSFVKYNKIEGKKIFSIGETTTKEIEKFTKDEIYTSEESTLEDLLHLIKNKL
ncbi:uroporphyrinogen-III synthase [Frigoriflavimonas asaccharolytica]|uniref:Uroporphyrinogen-III synthase n=1 Tax=Frigoriflavimonas asaccharolytica TaxID=2735899 RepID=A0A8J8G771_9FLAO|nr:uroporphyrinogen-III synthase [Frigoriflavimonas asaccharolytica]NRS92256.1 uroporphyrinogen-III synthase [Frigoriflavimonas asaccharolytica]